MKFVRAVGMPVLQKTIPLHERTLSDFAAAKNTTARNAKNPKHEPFHIRTSIWIFFAMLLAKKRACRPCISMRLVLEYIASRQPHGRPIQPEIRVNAQPPR